METKLLLIHSAIAHLQAIVEGEDNDPRTGLPHIEHASALVLSVARVDGSKFEPASAGRTAMETVAAAADNPQPKPKLSFADPCRGCRDFNEPKDADGDGRCSICSRVHTDANTDYFVEEKKEENDA